jgi:hypothetical protein
MIVIVYCPFFGLLNIQLYGQKCVIFENAFLLIFFEAQLPRRMPRAPLPGSVLGQFKNKPAIFAIVFS